MPLINSEVSLTLTWSENCVLTNITTQTARDADPNDPNADPPVEARPEIKAPTSEKFKNNRHKIICSSCYFINKR